MRTLDDVFERALSCQGAAHRTRLRCAATVLLLTGLALAGPAAAQDDIAVLAVDTSALGPSAGDPLPAADAVRRELAQTGVVVLGADDTARRLRSLGLAKSFALSTYEARLRAAEDAFAALDTERSLELLEETLADLAADAEPTPEKQALLESSRIRAAERLMALAGTSEQGEGVTPQGERALAHFVAALRVNPSLALSQTEHPPKMHRLFARAREAVTAAGSGRVSVSSTPSGATVYVEGKALGTTPLEVELPRGPHRVWVALDDARSVTRSLEVGDAPATLDVDIAFEGALWASGPGLRPVRGQTLTEGVASKVANLLGVGQLVLVGFASYDEARWLYGAVYSTSERQTVRRGAVRLSSDAPSADDIERLGAFLWSGDALSVDPSAVPRSVLPGDESPRVGEAGAAGAGEDDGLGGALLWTGVGVGAGALVLGAVGAGVIAALALSSEPAEPRGRFAVEVLP